MSLSMPLWMHCRPCPRPALSLNASTPEPAGCDSPPVLPDYLASPACCCPAMHWVLPMGAAVSARKVGRPPLHFRLSCPPERPSHPPPTTSMPRPSYTYLNPYHNHQ